MRSGQDHREAHLPTTCNYTPEDSGKAQRLKVQTMLCVPVMTIVTFGQDYLLLFCILMFNFKKTVFNLVNH